MHMLLWNDYEGKTIDGKYLLGPLLGPEGRSALFAVAEGAETPSAIAITESLNDEQQMLACWTRIASIEQENLVALRHYGRTEIEGSPLTYVVMEASDGTLADLLKERAATHDESVQIAVSLTSALQALHAAGLTHGHIVAENVVAVGEAVKLRTDCIREYTEDSPSERDARICKDVHDLSLLVLRTITLERAFTPETRLAAPFRRVVANGINGTWGLAEIADALTPPAAKPVVTQAAEPLQYSLPEIEPIAFDPVTLQPVMLDDIITTRRIETEIAPMSSFDPRRYALVACLVIALVLLCVHLLRGKPVESAKTAPPPPPVTATVAPSPVAATEDHTSIASHMAAGWYVIAYTYNREDQAWKKAAAIMKQHPRLQPAVVSPGGHGQFLVAIGGPMTRDGAVSVRTKAVRAGMPRDTFVRNYSGA
jgi:hypothetical protein